LHHFEVLVTEQNPGLVFIFQTVAARDKRLRCNAAQETDWQPALGQIIATWVADREAELQTRRPVASSRIPNFGNRGPQTIYVTSEQFGITVPLDADLEEPAGVYLDRIITGFKLPRVLDYEGRMGVPAV
jgi:hypothetical protein